MSSLPAIDSTAISSMRECSPIVHQTLVSLASLPGRCKGVRIRNPRLQSIHTKMSSFRLIDPLSAFRRAG